jgi:hypothetical protein
VRTARRVYVVLLKFLPRCKAKLHLVNVKIVERPGVVRENPELLVALSAGVESNTNVLVLRSPFPIDAACLLVSLEGNGPNSGFLIE